MAEYEQDDGPLTPRACKSNCVTAHASIPCKGGYHEQHMNDKDLEQLKAHVTKLAKSLKSEADLGDLTLPDTHLHGPDHHMAILAVMFR